MEKKIQSSQLTVVEASKPLVSKLAISVSAAWTSKCLANSQKRLQDLEKFEAFTKVRSDWPDQFSIIIHIS